MLEDINQEIFELKEKLRVKNKLDSLKKMVNEEIKKRKAQEIVLEDILIKEEKDVQRLESTNISSIFVMLIGKRDEKLDKEREEYLTAKLRYEECIEAIKELENELEKVNKELINYSSVKEEYNKAIKEKEDILINEGSHRSKDLKDNLANINDLKIDIKEIREAIQAGVHANNALEDMKEHLNKAKNWGMWDMMGGGLISSMAKHAAIDEANTIAHNSQHLLKSFEKELLDVNEFTDIEVNLSSFESFADFFFDGFFIDWFVQSKINDSINRVENTYSKIDSIIIGLRSNLQILESNLLESESKVKVILEL